MLIVFVCFELGFTEYGIVVPVLTIAGVVILVLGAVSYFVYDPYRLDRKNHKKADRYIRDIEKAAVKEVELEEKALAKQARKQEKLELKEETLPGGGRDPHKDFRNLCGLCEECLLP